MVGADAKRAEHLDRDQPARRVEQAATEHHVPDDFSGELGDQAERSGIVGAQRVHQRGDRGAGRSERAGMDVPHRGVIMRLLRAKLHAHGR